MPSCYLSLNHEIHYEVSGDLSVWEVVDLIVENRNRYIDKSWQGLLLSFRENSWVNLERCLKNEVLENEKRMPLIEVLAPLFPAMEEFYGKGSIRVTNRDRQEILLVEDLKDMHNPPSYSQCAAFLNNLPFSSVILPFRNLIEDMQRLCSQGGDEDYVSITEVGVETPSLVFTNGFDVTGEPSEVLAFRNNFRIFVGTHS